VSAIYFNQTEKYKVKGEARIYCLGL